MRPALLQLARAAWLALAFLALTLTLGAACGATQQLAHARVVTTIAGNSEMTGAALPYHWDAQSQARDGVADFDIAFSLPGEPTEPWAVYFAHIGTAWEVWLNGSLLARSGDLLQPDGADFAKAPRVMSVPLQLLQKENLLRVHLRADGGRQAGLAAPLVGPEDEVREVYKLAYRWRVAGSLVVSLFSLIVGTLAMVLWLTQSNPALTRGLRRDPIYLFGGLAELAWALYTGDRVIEQPPLIWPAWGTLISAACVCWLCCVALFCLQAARLDSARARRLLGAVGVSGLAAAAWAVLRDTPRVWDGWFGLAALGLLLCGVYCIRQVWRRPDAPGVLVGVALLLNALAAIHDGLVVLAGGAFPGENDWLHYSSVLFGLALGYIVVARFRAASAQARDLMDHLAARVASKERELATSYEKLEQMARAEERSSERARILRDMHDGVGSHISAAIRQLQSGRASHAEVLQTLRDSLDQLKLSIDSMNLPPGDVTALLANLRYRLEPRFAASDIELQWAVQRLEPLAALDANAMRQLQFMVFEALSNVLQHARADVLRIEACPEDGGVHLSIIDNGVGFDTSRPPRKGLASMRERAQAIGAQLALSSGPGRTVVSIRLRPPAGTAAPPVGR